MKSRLIPILCLVAFAGAALYLMGPGHERSEDETPPPNPAGAQSPSPQRKTGDALVQKQRQPAKEPTVMPNMVQLAEQLNDPDGTVQDDVAIVQEMIRVYTRSVGTVPEGGLNEEIVEGLLGDNPMKLIFLGKENPRINGQGELTDRFGTPYDFHPVSSQELEIRSAGPDKVHFTADDVVPE